ncbi:polyprenyl synthetase family protein [Mycolicibacterium vaccae]|uniref:polyprenyl synthetase family protein n=1 Tax=Mycolicibacterium vaccae TaxID=1810 RepID=UPI003CFA2D79
MSDTDQTTFLSALEDHLLRTVTEAVAEPLRAVDRELDGIAGLCHSAVQAGGKRLRPRFAYWAWRVGAAPGVAAGPLVGLGAALELLHAAILVHDDVIDSSEVRRGKPSVRAALAAEHRAEAGWGDSREFGDHMALLVGDILWSTAHDTFDAAVAGLPADVAQRTSRAFRSMRVEVLAGQLLELRAQAGRDYRAATAEKILRYKTSVYTVERPMELGLLVAGVTAPDIAAAVHDYAAAVGQAFQLRDDLADLYGTTDSSGKRGGDDIRSGKPTELLGFTLDRAGAAEVDSLTAIVGRQDAGDDEIARARQIVLGCGAVDHVRGRIADLVGTAEGAIERLAGIADAPTRAGLEAMLTECTELSFLPVP